MSVSLSLSHTHGWAGADDKTGDNDILSAQLQSGGGGGGEGGREMGTKAEPGGGGRGCHTAGRKWQNMGTMTEQGDGGGETGRGEGRRQRGVTEQEEDGRIQGTVTEQGAGCSDMEGVGQ